MRKAKDKRRRSSILERLKPEEGQDVLRRILAVRPNLRAEAEKFARSVLAEATFEGIAEEVEDAVGACDLDDLNSRARPHRRGYVDPSEAAWEILEEAVEPFVSDIKRQLELGLEAQATEICKGVVLGLYRAEHGKRGELVEWAPDFPGETAGHAIETWLTGKRARKPTGAAVRRNRLASFREFADRFVPEWRDAIVRTLSRRR